ncbi:MAG: (Fe-S)-binding protein [Desulfobacterales bacterium]|nr:(Fe-S)-binding protein [Desulfobacterales bacterium]
MNDIDIEKDKLIKEISKCRSCRFCVDVCPTYQASEGVESMCSFGRLQIIKYLLKGSLKLDDAMSYCLYSCLQCKRCEVVCKSKGQNLEVCDLIHRGRTLVSNNLVEDKAHDQI